jgi:cyclic pyranopterin phosphate synthase
MKARLTHLDENGQAAMVDVSDKTETSRSATAAGKVFMTKKTLDLIKSGSNKKGDALSVARLAGIMGAKKTSEIIPLCHPLPLSGIEVILTPNSAESSVDIEATCRVLGRTGVEMEALNAVMIAALTVYDMCKAVDRSMTISDVRLIEKSGGRSGLYKADE